MPEADAVERTARSLRRLDGQVVTGCDLRWPTRASTDLSGYTVLGTARVGKHLLTRLGGGPLGSTALTGPASTGSALTGPESTGPALTLHSHLRMDGSWRVFPNRGRHPPGGHTVRAVLATARWTAVGDQLGMLDLVLTDQEHTLVGHLGPDILDPALDPAVVGARAVQDPARPIGQTLLDQRVVAGLGTIWVSESLYIQGVNPWTPAADVTRLPRLLAQVALMLRTELTGRPVRPNVYGRRHLPCHRCGTPVRRDPIGEPPQQRELFWCPGCQPDPG